MVKYLVRALGALTLLAAPVGNTVFAQSAPAQTIQLDDFESGSIRIVNSAETDPMYSLLWNQYTNDFYAGPDPGTQSISTTQAHTGTHSLQIDVTGGNVYLEFYPATTSWHNMHEYVQPASAWVPNTYNAMRFWVKVPPQMVQETGGHENVQIGTYVRQQGGDSGTQGTHYYHFYNFKYTGEWEQVIFDSHPSYLIGAGGNTEEGNVAYPNGDKNWNYMDQLTRFYFDGQGGLSSTPATFYFDGFELFTRPANENIDQVYALHAVYVPKTNEVDVGWSRRKDQDSLQYEVRYSYSDINASGWNAATPAPNGIIPGNGAGAYALMSYSTTGINVSGKSVLYVAIKPTTATTFRQIAIPIGTSSVPPPAQVSLPDPPTNVTVK